MLRQRTFSCKKIRDNILVIKFIHKPHNISLGVVSLVIVTKVFMYVLLTSEKL